MSSESVWVELRNDTQKIILGVIYRPQNTSKDDSSPLRQEMNRARSMTWYVYLRILTLETSTGT